MFSHLEAEHKQQQQLLYYDLEFKRIEFNCYLSKENPCVFICHAKNFGKLCRIYC